MSQTAWLIEII